MAQSSTPQGPQEPQTERSSSASFGPAPNPFQRILVPIDFSSAARAAFAFAMQLVERWGGDVVVFHAPGVDQNDEFLRHTGVPWDKSDVIADAREHLRRFADTVVPGSAERVRAEVSREDDVVRAVVRACERHAPSLVVLGTRWEGRRRWRRSTAERIARALACPVVLVRGEREAAVDADM